LGLIKWVLKFLAFDNTFIYVTRLIDRVTDSVRIILQVMEHERQGILHHLIDIMDPKDDFSAGDFYYAARDAIEDVVKRGKTPIVVGGTGFYLKWLVCGKPSTPIATKESEENVRLALEQAFSQVAKEKETKQEEDVEVLSTEEKWKAGVALVRSLGDKETADRLEHQETNNWYRMTRVLDILLQSPGKTLAELDTDAATPPDYDFRCIFLHRPRITLYRRIDERVEHMLCQGLLTETAEKLTFKGLEPDTNCATRAIGYRQAMKYLQHILENPSEAISEKDIVGCVFLFRHYYVQKQDPIPLFFLIYLYYRSSWPKIYKMHPDNYAIDR